MKPGIDATQLMREALERHKIHLSLLVADTGLWANPEFHRRLVKKNQGQVALYPDCCRARKGEKRGPNGDGVRLDDNTYANVAIKRATGLGRTSTGFEACHIWPDTCYDSRYHTAIANLVLLPRALAGLSDHDVEIQKVLQYRAFELYDWYPEGEAKPVKPEFYPPSWREPQLDPGLKIRRACAVASPSDAGGDGKTSVVLAIELIPADPDEFKQKLLRSKRARIAIEYSDGSKKEVPWVAKRISETSNVIGNLRSRKEFRSGNWQGSRISQIVVRVEE